MTTTYNSKPMYEKELKLIECLCIVTVNISHILSRLITLQNRYYYLHFIDKELELPRGFIFN